MTLASCIMPTFNRPRFVGQAVRYFLAQDYPEKELIIVDDGSESVADVVPSDPQIRYFRREGRLPLGAKRNFACEQARGEIIVHWDDDDWNAPWRLRYQVEQLGSAQAEICGLERVFFYAPKEERAWEYVYPGGQRRWVYGASLCYRKSFWQQHRFPEIHVGEDTRFVWADGHARIHVLPDPRFLVALIHENNTSPKHTTESRYHPKPVAEIENLLGGDAAFYHPGRQPVALVTAASGIGDVIRVTPLVRALHRMGYVVDVLLAPDFPGTAQLIEGAPEVRRVVLVPNGRDASGRVVTDGLGDHEYDVATYTIWSARLKGGVRSQRALAFERGEWLAAGDSRSVERIARELGWAGELPAPFAMASERRFGLAPGTIALHPGCKYEWPWKKWHGFDKLARRFPHVVVVGTQEDTRNDNTYFRRPFAWPEHAQDFIGKLSLPDTAALLRECAALVSNDSGLMHLGVALGVPTFGLFGITNPLREAIPSPHMNVVTKKLSCEPECRKGPWGRRDCHRHLECLQTLTPDEVFMHVAEALPKIARAPSRAVASPPRETESRRETINLVYYGWVFQASGYGQAARGYLHALHRAGINLSVVDLGGGRAVNDPLVDSLLGRKLDADFHLFHGVPPQWARHAFPLRNVIAMTVWETDAMPMQWRSALNHALEVWLPCEFNTAVFARDLQRPVFKLPHPLLPRTASAREGLPADLAFDEHDIVFYSIFEWQDRKGPAEALEAFLRAFTGESSAVLVLKTSAGAAAAAGAALTEARKRTASTARVILRCEGWSETQIAALHARGNIYVSLHRGEGWNLPLFEAACLGKPIVATGFSGPLEYLDPGVHGLVRHSPAPVRQRYAYYLPSMNWAAPDIDHAAELMRQAAGNHAELSRRCAISAERLREKFSLETVGAAARTRLLELLRKTNPQKWERLRPVQRPALPAPSQPIPADWYDADYFENGIKSNWRNGYSWALFRGVFEDAADFLIRSFPDAVTFLDVGCAKGFLVRALRERGREAWGIDHSPWALRTAENCAKPFLSPADVNDAGFERTFDVVVAMSLFESLTEEQIHAFLPRARAWTRQAMFAVIATTQNGTHAANASGDRDLSHINLRPREWWRERFSEAGWKQDAVHKIAERACQSDPLPKKMGWTIYLFSPG